MRAIDYDIVDNIVKHGQVWLDQPFPPGYGGQEVGGVDLVLLDTYADGCVATFVANKGRLDREQIIILKRCLHDLDVVMPLLEGQASEYFTELHIVVRQIMQFVR